MYILITARDVHFCHNTVLLLLATVQYVLLAAIELPDYLFNSKIGYAPAVVTLK